ncbi:MAG: hypothetical protein M9918_15520 [Anaerolineae bacterium]|nr:hypothetical protein [Anaerolineae bacterium]
MQRSLVNGERSTRNNREELHTIPTVDELIRTIQHDLTRDLRQGCGQGDVRAEGDDVGRGAGAFVGIRQEDAGGKLSGGGNRPGRRAERFVGKGTLHRLAVTHLDRQRVTGQAETAAGSGTGGAG